MRFFRVPYTHVTLLAIASDTMESAQLVSSFMEPCPRGSDAVGFAACSAGCGPGITLGPDLGSLGFRFTPLVLRQPPVPQSSPQFMECSLHRATPFSVARHL